MQTSKGKQAFLWRGEFAGMHDGDSKSFMSRKQKQIWVTRHKELIDEDLANRLSKKK